MDCSLMGVGRAGKEIWNIDTKLDAMPPQPPYSRQSQRAVVSLPWRQPQTLAQEATQPKQVAQRRDVGVWGVWNLPQALLDDFEERFSVREVTRESVLNASLQVGKFFGEASRLRYRVILIRFLAEVRCRLRAVASKEGAVVVAVEARLTSAKALSMGMRAVRS